MLEGEVLTTVPSPKSQNGSFSIPFSLYDKIIFSNSHEMTQMIIAKKKAENFLLLKKICIYMYLLFLLNTISVYPSSGSNFKGLCFTVSCSRLTVNIFVSG